MYRLVIAEKPSLARKIKDCLVTKKGIRFNNKDGYFESENVVITSVFGHLFTVYDLADYDESWKSWTSSYKNLPFTFSSAKDMKYKLSKNDGIKERYKLIANLLKDADEVVHAGDADREGEIIVRNILGAAKYRGTVLRLWLPAQDVDTIAEAWDSMKNDKEYQNLANEGVARTIVDSLYGFNLTRYLTCVGGDLYKVGSVKVPIVEAIYDRELEIRNFVPSTYFTAEHTGKKDDIEYVLKSSKKFDDRSDAEAYVTQLMSDDLVVTDVKKTKSVVNPKRLFSLTTLQNAMAKRYKYTNDVTLDALQKLYDEGLVTYPRTDTEYLADSEKDTVKQVLNTMHDARLTFKDSKKIFDSSKVESHSALTPTRQIVDPETISDLKQRNVYKTIVNRFKANFWKEDCIVAKTTVTFESVDKFTLSGKSIIQKGWLDVEENDAKDTIIPSFEKNEHVKPNFAVSEKQTKPKPHYTVESLNNYLEAPFKDELEEKKSDEEYTDLLKGLSIGTVATRANIIKQLVDSEYITLNKVTYGITERGESMMRAIRKNNIHLSKDKTIELGGWLKEVYQGTKTVDDIVHLVDNELHEICDTSKPIAERSGGKGSERPVLCKCPKCGGNVYVAKRKSDGSPLWFCGNYKAEGDEKCDFIIGSPMKYFANEINMTDTKVKTLCAGKTISAKILKKDGGKRDAKLKLAFNGKYTNLEEVKMETATGGTGEKKGLCECPRCHRGVVYKANGKNMYYCSRYKDEDPCEFRLFSPMRFFSEQVELSEGEVVGLCEGLSVSKMVKSKTGRRYKAELKIAFNGPYTNLVSVTDGMIH